MSDIAALEGRIRIAMAGDNWFEADTLGRTLDSLQQDLRNPPVPMVEAAVWYASQGLRVFPCWPNRKEPMTEHGFHDATTDIAIVRSWWTYSTSEANIGIATGHLVDVIDVDPAGVEQWKHLSSTVTDLPPFLGVASTRRPWGTHFYIAAENKPTDPGGTTTWHPGIDIKGLGGYVIAPPSIVDQDDAQGDYWPGTGVRYRWTQPLDLERLRGTR